VTRAIRYVLNDKECLKNSCYGVVVSSRNVRAETRLRFLIAAVCELGELVISALLSSLFFFGGLRHCCGGVASSSDSLQGVEVSLGQQYILFIFRVYARYAIIFYEECS
jgi:hypothetical protein